VVAAADLSFRLDSYPRVFVFAILPRRIDSEGSVFSKVHTSCYGEPDVFRVSVSPLLYICNSVCFFQHCCCFTFRLTPFGALLQLCTVCIERPSYSFAWIGCSFAEFFHLLPTFHFPFPWPKLWSGSTTLPKQYVGLAAHFSSSPKIGSYFENWFRKQKVFRFLIALLLSFLWSSYPERPGCFPLSVVCSSPSAFTLSGSVVWCVPFSADTRWSNLQSFKERCYRSNFVRVSGNSPTIFRRSWLLSEPVPKNLIKNLSFRVLCLSS
jgi:hypothetical protein